jgi:hypothetical protein
MMIKGKRLRNSPLAHDYKTHPVGVAKILIVIFSQNFNCVRFKFDICVHKANVLTLSYRVQKSNGGDMPASFANQNMCFCHNQICGDPCWKFFGQSRRNGFGGLVKFIVSITERKPSTGINEQSVIWILAHKSRLNICRDFLLDHLHRTRTCRQYSKADHPQQVFPQPATDPPPPAPVHPPKRAGFQPAFSAHHICLVPNKPQLAL